VPVSTPPRQTVPPPASSTETPATIAERVTEREENREKQFKSATAMVRQGKVAAAKDIFRQLAIESPTTKKYRVYMHYAWGRELQEARREEEARAEYNRALSLDPDFAPALQAIATLRVDKPATGKFLSKLFGKE
jgi:tetratricopeptide (TPR) repeat protein